MRTLDSVHSTMAPIRVVSLTIVVFMIVFPSLHADEQAHGPSDSEAFSSWENIEGGKITAKDIHVSPKYIWLQLRNQRIIKAPLSWLCAADKKRATSSLGLKGTIRLWTNRRGQGLKAQLLDATELGVSLMSISGNRVRVPISWFAEHDQLLVQQYLEQKRERINSDQKTCHIENIRTRKTRNLDTRKIKFGRSRLGMAPMGEVEAQEKGAEGWCYLIVEFDLVVAEDGVMKGDFFWLGEDHSSLLGNDGVTYNAHAVMSRSDGRDLVQCAARRLGLHQLTGKTTTRSVCFKIPDTVVPMNVQINTNHRPHWL